MKKDIYFDWCFILLISFIFSRGVELEAMS